MNFTKCREKCDKSDSRVSRAARDRHRKERREQEPRQFQIIAFPYKRPVPVRPRPTIGRQDFSPDFRSVNFPTVHNVPTYAGQHPRLFHSFSHFLTTCVYFCLLMSTDRDPLLSPVATLPGASVAATDPPPASQLSRRLGPLEITRSTRWGILAGIWVATFLSVSECPQIHHTHLFNTTSPPVFEQYVNVMEHTSW